MTAAGWLVCTDESIGQLRGSASQATVEDPFAFERANYALTRRSRVAPQELTPSSPNRPAELRREN
jgi:hypothetical protein